ncbi:LLM class flavin-dependent oxidoreductase [Aquihabitans sp. G128]|uniref:LLM class flavin-dependent oxidoreductase n=1 Tax=Aquihabitans sp. G128 TaxID=2849779 RepID=UPI001C2153EC|nr:LLM class flavin-dependent oxidoreductase [Aquihabitans sp. G128]QXC60864.1 LLM class flavin-dependent oxidoreductase [Aquihabitans sp. G128]
MTEHLHLAVALDGAGWHPAAWRLPDARPGDLFDAAYWVDLAQAAERGGLDLLTIEDAFTLQSDHPFRPDDRTDQVRGRLDAALVATRIAPATTHIGLVPTVTTTHTEPFHVATKVASLDWVSGGRAGWRVQVLRQQAEVDQFGRRVLLDRSQVASPEDRQALSRPLFDEAADAVEVSRRLWDSWEDDAEIRDRPTGRFIDREKLHHIDFEGEHFSVRGPSITPRSPQGQPLVVVLAHHVVPYELAARSADVVFTTPHDAAGAAAIVAEVRAAEERVGREGRPLLVHADLLVLLEADRGRAEAARAELDELDGRAWRSDAEIVATDPEGLADLLADWQAAGIEGFRLRPARLPTDLDAIADALVPVLRARGLRPAGYGPGTLRERLGLGRPPSRYAADPHPERTPA